MLDGLFDDLKVGKDPETISNIAYIIEQLLEKGNKYEENEPLIKRVVSD